ncbi:hypothetical protein [Bacteroides acidifaciens]|uniref:hypothetical protein n=1 Tax=Bacteroides acidifaciens TaxID=85831 RepID=UPI00248BC3E1|nr:hypothetical protein [Bacteroides acidifaciens]
MQRVEEQDQTAEVFENDIAMYLQMFCEEQQPPIEDMSKESQSRWNAALMYVKRHVFPDSSILKSKDISINNNINNIMPSNYNAYDYDMVSNVCDYYIYLCMLYDKEVSAVGFSLLTGIDRYTIATWRDEGTKLSKKSSDIGKKIYDFREESLSAKLATANKNPVGILAILNRHYQWNMPGVKEQRQTQRLASREELGLEAPKERPALPGMGGND